MTKARAIKEPLLGEDGTDWSQPSLLPFYLKPGYATRNDPELPPVEVDPIEEDDLSDSEVVKQNTTLAVHMTLLERYEMETK